VKSAESLPYSNQQTLSVVRDILKNHLNFLMINSTPQQPLLSNSTFFNGTSATQHFLTMPQPLNT